MNNPRKERFEEQSSQKFKKWKWKGSKNFFFLVEWNLELAKEEPPLGEKKPVYPFHFRYLPFRMAGLLLLCPGGGSGGHFGVWVLRGGRPSILIFSIVRNLCGQGPGPRWSAN
jgi:hypothetical protein